MWYRGGERGMRSSSSSSGSGRRRSTGGSGNLGAAASKARESLERGGSSSALDLAELLEKKDLSAAEVLVIRQNMVQVHM